MDYQKQRKKLVEWTKSQLTGLEVKDGKRKPLYDVLFGTKPLDRFFTGFLFPIGDESAEELDSDVEEYAEEVEETLSVKKTKHYLPPSSAGFSFFISGENVYLRVYFNAVNYELLNQHNEDGKFTKSENQRWKCHSLGGDGLEVEFLYPEGKQDVLLDSKPIFAGKAKIEALWRKYNDGYIVTITLSNAQKKLILDHDTSKNKERINEENQKTLFQVEFKCIIESGKVAAYPSKDRELLSNEEKEIELRYKNLHIYAIGHGVAVDWSLNSQGQMEIWSDFMPAVEVPQVTADTSGADSKVLEFTFLSECETNDNVIFELKKFVADYAFWIKKQASQVLTEEKQDQQTAQNIVDKMIIAKTRMGKSIAFLEQNEHAKTAFSIANTAMLDQMISVDKIKGTKKDKAEYKWRPFQIAFVLMVLESAIDEDSEYRDEVDLIWFPTGGGKTEAYLGLMAFLFIYRRLKYPASYGGTASFMRYTLRLLTSQQFLRACKVISALELIRRQNSTKFGKEPITIGLWLGGASSPNTYNQATEYFNKEDFSKFVLSSCPWCGDTFTAKNYVVAEDDFHFTCTNKECDLGKEFDNILPFNVVDEALYKKPPSLLIATVDKFARLTWDERTASFFGKNGNRAPELIVQDELHLISSALGSIVGLYEAGIDTLLIARGIRAKYIASTATIKNAAKQVQNLFAREMQIFPPSGLRYDDSYFAKTVPIKDKPGRLYIGYLAPKLSKSRCLEPLAGVLLAAPTKLFKDAEQFLDSWWTQVIYHGSLKGVNNSYTVFQSGAIEYLAKLTIENLKKDIDEVLPGYTNGRKLKSIDDFMKIDEPELKSIVEKYLPIRELNIGSLTSKRSARETAQIFDTLAKPKYEKDAIDIALATNMISVGLDVSRLALMIINGQPLTTAEYIQASSRVGRAEIPGIVFINYYKTQARSLSHYENFRPYHDSFYRFVEPSSLTPFTYQVRKRALHAALVIAMRYSNIGLLENDKAGNFDPDNEKVKRVIKLMKQRISEAMKPKDKVCQTDKDKINKVHDHIDNLVTEWHNEIQFDKFRSLVYNSKDRGTSNLICNFDEDSGIGIPWATLQSMRNVENIALTKLVKGVKLKNEF